MLRNAPWLMILLALLWTAACAPAQDGDVPKPSSTDDPDPPQPYTEADVVAPIPAFDNSELSQRFDSLKAEVDRVGKQDAPSLLSSYPSGLGSALSYDPAKSAHLDTIQGSALALSDAELNVLTEQGLVISTRREFPTFLRGLAEIYAEHLPLYVSADALLEAVHTAYDQILLQFERRILLPDLQAMLSGMRQALPNAPFDAATKADADLYLAVATSLLNGAPVEPVAGASSADIGTFFDNAVAASGIATPPLFGKPRMLDFSQFTPRGHYTGEGPEMEQYFRAMMWLGRIDLRLVETLSNGTQVFRPEQYQASLLLSELVATQSSRWERIDETIRTFVGESDYMVVPEMAQLIADLGGLEAAKAADKDAVVAAIVAGGYGEQQIASHLMVNDGTVARLPLNRSFLVFGQRYIADSHVFSEVTYDRVGRMMPSPLDAAFAALGNNQALSMLQPELEQVGGYAGALSRMRVLIDNHDDDFWEANFYNLWLSALRALSPAPTTSGDGLPEIARTDAFGLRVLNAQLGSWAELRHDTLLYAKQSYSGIPGCAFPDAYVDPYPAFYAALQRYAEHGQRIVALAEAALPSDDYLVMQASTHFDALKATSATLREMAEYQLRGEPFSDAHMAFINRAVRVDLESAGCTTIEVPNGWYADLFFDREKSLEFDPTIADVHTQPAEWDGTIVGKILHVGTGYPRMMVTTIDTCEGPKAYAGVVYAYHEHVTKDFDRLTDERWAERFWQDGERPQEVPWLMPVLGQP